MKKFILSIIFGIGILFSMSSCAVSTYAQDEIYYDVDDDISIVIRYGTPYYFEGSILYYSYNGWYYYPYYLNNSYYYYRYSRPLPPPRHGHRFVPRHGDRPHYYGGHHHNHHFDRHHGNDRGHIDSGHIHHNGGIQNGRPNIGGSRNHGFNRPNNGGVRPSVRPRFNGGNRGSVSPRMNGGGSMRSHGGVSRPSMGGGHRYGGRR